MCKPIPADVETSDLLIITNKNGVLGDFVWYTK